MKSLWDVVLPPDKRYVVWGAGKNGLEWLDFLARLNRSVVEVIDQNKTGFAGGIKITPHV